MKKHKYNFDLTYDELDLLTDAIADLSYIATPECTLGDFDKFRDRYKYKPRDPLDKLWVKFAFVIGKTDSE